MDGSLPEFVPRGPAALMKCAFDNVDLLPLRLELRDRYIFEPTNAEALMDLAVVEQIFGDLAAGLAVQAEALALRRLYRSPASAARPTLRLLAFAAAGDLGANIPLEFLLEGADIELHTLYIVPGLPLPETVPEHDVAIVAIGESDAHHAALAATAALAAEWPRPVLNRPDHIARLARDRLHALLEPVAGLTMPATCRIGRGDLRCLGTGERAIAKILPGGGFPLIIRPVDSHAGRGLEKLADAAAIPAYLAARTEAEFHLAPFVDYRSADRLFRKYRIAFVAGLPYPVHMASLDDWRIWYVNAGMRDSAVKRAEEANFLTLFDDGFGRRHDAALTALAERIGLDYFGIDCAETGDGRLLVFEADIAQVVHNLDPPSLFPHKAPAMRRLFRAFQEMLTRRGGPGTR